jgi:glycine betaine/proline transport system permease protein
MDWINTFPTLGRESLRILKKSIDSGFRDFTREWGEAIENLFEPLKAFLIFCERLLSTSPWWAVLGVILLMIWWATRSRRIVLGAAISFLLMGYLGMWQDTMKTVSMILVSTLVAIAIGLPIGVAMSRSDRLQRWVNPVLDVMQTMPSFVYLIPVVMLLGIGKVPGLIAVVIYALPPMIRFTNLGIRLVDADVLEAADAFGSSTWQKNDASAIATGAADHHGGYQPNHHAGIVNGGHRVDDRRARLGPTGAQGHHQPIFRVGSIQWTGDCGHRDCV